MEAFEQFVALAMEAEGLIVSEALKFPVRRQTRKASHTEYQTHGFEVDLIGARRDRLVLATVKSYFGSRGVSYDQVSGASANTAGNARYALPNDQVVRTSVIRQAAARFGYDETQVELRLYVGKFAGAANEELVRNWRAGEMAGAGPILVVGSADVVSTVRMVASNSQYRDSAVLATLKVLDHNGALAATRPN